MKGERSVLAVVPARGGSKGVPRKNLAVVGGMTLVGRALTLAHDLDWVDLVVLTTDDPEIAEEARRLGFDVPWLRPSELSTDLALGFAVWRHAHLKTEEIEKTDFDISILLQPTSPFRTADDVEQCVDLLVGSDFDAVTTVSTTPSHYAPEKTMTVNAAGYVEPYLSAAGFQPTRQLIPTYYHLNGVCYAIERQALLDRDQVFGLSTGAVVIDRVMVNIDEPLDLELANWLWDRE